MSRLVRCNNCDELYLDGAGKLIMIEDEYDRYPACRKCKTDEFLMDNPVIKIVGWNYEEIKEEIVKLSEDYDIPTRVLVDHTVIEGGITMDLVAELYDELKKRY